MKNDLKVIFQAAVGSVLPETLLSNQIKYQSNKLIIQEKSFIINENVNIIGFGKAVYGMGKYLFNLLGNQVQSTILSVPVGTKLSLIDEDKQFLKHATILEGAKDNLPDEQSHEAALKIFDKVKNLRSSDVLLFLISGGGSALLPLPIPPISIFEKSQVIKDLSKAGASINELNSVRQCLSMIKGGKLVSASKCNTCISLIISDVIGDPINIIAGGPTVKIEGNKSLGIEILKKYKLLDTVPLSVKNVLTQKNDFCWGDSNSAYNFLVGNNNLAAETAAKVANELGYTSLILTTSISGEARTVGEKLTKLIKIIDMSEVLGPEKCKQHLNSLEFLESESIEKLISMSKEEYLKNGLCLIFGGETTVTVHGNGSGGRNQELALSCAMHAAKHCYEFVDWTALSAGTDGIDGPTNAAGAFALPSTFEEAKLQGIDISKYMHNNDSHSFFSIFKGGEDMLITGHTGTNVMDLITIIIKSK